MYIECSLTWILMTFQGDGSEVRKDRIKVKIKIQQRKIRGKVYLKWVYDNNNRNRTKNLGIFFSVSSCPLHVVPPLTLHHHHMISWYFCVCSPVKEMKERHSSSVGIDCRLEGQGVTVSSLSFHAVLYSFLIFRVKKWSNKKQ